LHGVTRICMNSQEVHGVAVECRGCIESKKTGWRHSRPHGVTGSLMKLEGAAWSHREPHEVSWDAWSHRRPHEVRVGCLESQGAS
jgi:hypothetical protein